MTELKVSAYTAESGHWYTRNGEPMYQIEGANGKIRNTTLRDARKHNLVPSVTTILNVAAKPGLDNWKLQQVLLAALTLPRNEGEPEGAYIDRIISDSKEQGRSAADAGTEIHASVEKFFKNQDWICERPFAHETGFGGKVDMFARGTIKSDDGIVLDIKTKEFYDSNKVEGYDEHMMQLAAYRVGIGMQSAKCANVFVSRSVPGLVKIIEWSPEDLQRGWKMFYRLLEFWQFKNNYK